MNKDPLYYQLTEAQLRTVALNASLARSIFYDDPSFSASGGSWRWHTYQHIASGVDIKVDLLEGQVYYFKYGHVTVSGLRSVTIPLDIFCDETIVQTRWKQVSAESSIGGRGEQGVLFTV